jgi:hypothetical protein
MLRRRPDFPRATAPEVSPEAVSFDHNLKFLRYQETFEVAIRTGPARISPEG